TSSCVGNFWKDGTAFLVVPAVTVSMAALIRGDLDPPKGSPLLELPLFFNSSKGFPGPEAGLLIVSSVILTSWYCIALTILKKEND
ncbi:hypothetical protein IW262DRAFT_1368042, partial [Armillaria fumosa]